MPASRSPSSSAPASGGGYDMQARMAARHLGKHIPGNPTVVVQNMPAREASPPPTHVQHRAEGRHHHRADPARHAARQADLSGRHPLRPRASSAGSAASTARPRHVGLAHAPRIRRRRICSSKELIVGGIASVDPETTPRLYNSLIGTKFKIVTGYNSTAQIALGHRARRGAGHRRLVVVEPQGGAAALDRDKQGDDADAGRAAERSGARRPAERARLHQERRPTAR